MRPAAQRPFAALAWMASAVLGAAGLAGCGGTDFAGGSARAAEPSDKVDDDEDADTDSANALGVVVGQDASGRDIKRREEDFSGGSSKAPIDMVWIIDNSGSMSDKIAQVQTNLNRFLATVGSQSDLSVAVLTEICGGASGMPGMGFDEELCLTLDGSAGAVRKIDINVGSYNPLAILASAEAPAGAISIVANPNANTGGMGSIFGGGFPGGGGPEGATIQFQGQPMPVVPATGGDFQGMQGVIEAPEQITAASGKLSDFFRPQGAKVVVMVSDEDEFAIGADGYDLVMKALGAPHSNYTFFGFVGTQDTGFGRGGGCSSMKSAQYPALAQRSGGKVYDVCIPDWSPSFDELTKDVLAAAKDRFPLAEASVTRIVSVTVNGVELGEGGYRLEGGVLTFTSGVAADAAVHVVYEFVTD